jgi:hypothetical protein
MVHEAPDINMFFHQVCSCLKPNGRIFIAEPKFHVSQGRFQEIIASAQKYGLKKYGSPCIRFSRCAILEKESLGSLIA